MYTHTHAHAYISASCQQIQTHSGRYLLYFPPNCFLFFSAFLAPSPPGRGVVIDEVLGIDANLQFSIDRPNKAQCPYLREAGLIPVGTRRCLGTFCSITASSVTTPTHLHQPPASSVVCFPSIHPPAPTVLLLLFVSSTIRDNRIKIITFLCILTISPTNITSVGDTEVSS